jgi:RNA polymerase sigma factor (sigma-70 family)
MTAKSLEIDNTIKRERGRLLNFIRRNVPTDEDAEDILQDVFLQFISAFDEIEYLGKVSAWLIKTAKNKIIDRYRKKKPETFSDNVKNLNDYDEESEILSLEDIIPDLSGMPDEIYWQNLIWKEIEDALEEMPAEQKEVFVMNEFEDLSFREISEIKKVPVNTLLSRKRYAVLFLRKKLKILSR